ncbi:ethyl tert-butyl ether degradation protein EthD [Rhizobium sp. Leaf311]|uniref:EthD domain-containing protein n=1 Tax=Rhizobium sp. Leaf311 TaxID=1736332 RepID=UPI00071400C8|nr:EthD domain-containing protein [Rhizobium sp. Leaf311]KQQ46799.1 ethyl tert-butyl ether degradation protein EthD [Rhizobium sp. Leaf311]
MIKIAITFKRKQGMSVEEFRAYRRDVHAPILFAIPEAKLIKRFVVSFPTHAPNWPEPSFDALVEAWFEKLEDIDTLYFCENFRTKVDRDHINFIDISTAQRIICEELVVV